MYTAITEPDPIQRKFIENAIEKEFPNTKIKLIKTKSDFRINFRLW